MLVGVQLHGFRCPLINSSIKEENESIWKDTEVFLLI